MKTTLKSSVLLFLIMILGGGRRFMLMTMPWRGIMAVVPPMAGKQHLQLL